MTPKFENVVNEEVYDPNRPATTLNILPRDVQVKLRKREIPFPRSEAYFKQLENCKSKKCVVSGGEHKQLSLEVGQTSSDGASESVQNCTPVNSVGVASDSMRSFTDSEASGNSGVQSFTEEHGTDCDMHSPMTCGVVTEKRTVDFRDKLFLAPLTTVS